MKIVGIICEYNPFHLGHQKQINWIRQHFPEECAIVCLMSGNFVQRGHPAIFDKSLRTKAALDGGADLVLELPTNYSLRSAEGFAAGGVEILGKFCDYLCFGSETGEVSTLTDTARALLSPSFSPALREQLRKGLSFPAARQAALAEMGADASLLANPNDILGVEYCKAILSQGCAMQPLPLRREGSYHDDTPDPENPSATALRALIIEGKTWDTYTSARWDGPIHTLEAGERAILARLRTMSEEEFESLPYGSEGLWRKVMHAVRSCGTLNDILAAAKSKRYTRTRLDRMVMCAYLGISREILEESAPWVRVLGFRDRGIAALKAARETGVFPHVGERMEGAYQQKENMWDDLYGLFRTDSPAPAGQASARRVCVLRQPLSSCKLRKIMVE